MSPVAKHQLEEICVQALNDVHRARKVCSVRLTRSSVGTVNWTLREVDPRFDIDDVKKSHAVIRDLQNRYRMVT